MENPEEVLQALDEFQKMRPSEIPRELEDYLCWVAKTGDPVYQWSLIKVLFREKLARVMTDFYEACPNIDGLAACPNVEHFNYDTMKSSLLERLESFANAPFTVQRICELLTSPRKEYNRIDKFMRAIEKNILVVSTREPGPTIRRSENGEGMVNGSVEDELAQGSQPSDEMEMETWVKDCGPNAASLPLHVSSDNDASQHSSVIGQNTSVVKQLSSINGSTESGSKQSLQSTSDLETLGPTFASSSSEFTESSSSDSSSSGPESVVGTSNVTSVVQETSSIVGEVPEAIINEDTSSQPSLDLEGDESEIERSTPLQTTFLSKGFLDSYKEKEKEKEEVAAVAEEVPVDEKVPEDEEPVNVSDMQENLEQNHEEVREEPTVVENSGATSVITETASVPELQQEVKEKETEQVPEKIEEPEQKQEEEEVKEKEEVEEKEEEKEEKKPQEPLECAETMTCGTVDESQSQVTIEETTEDSTETNSLVPEPIPIVEEPKEPEDEPKKWEGVSVIETAEEPERKVEVVPMASETECEPPKKVMIIEETTTEKKEESMEVDTDTPPAEPMDQDATESAS